MPQDDHVSIRMYNIGFGDCFLLTFPAPERPRKILIDCGVHFMGRNKEQPFDEVLNQLIEDIKEDGVPTLDLVIATHRHQDHVSGFANEVWNDVDVREVWMPWTENYEDKQAVEILLSQSNKAKKVHQLLDKMLTNPKLFGLDHAEQVEKIKAIKEFSENSLKNPDAMNMLHHGFKRKNDIPRKYLPFRDRQLNTMRPDFLPGVTVYVMGPSFDDKVIASMEPPKAEQWFKMMEDRANTETPPVFPFHTDWSRKPAELENPNAILGRRDRRRIQSVDDETAFDLAKGVEDAVNGTSLMMMFHVGNAYLFFPGDAQHGTWQCALKDDEWRELLTRTNFYKVGHHGSHNATPKEFVHKVLRAESNCKAMVSVYPVKIFDQIPKDKLLADLVALPAEYVRSDKVIDPGDPEGFVRTALYVDTKIPV
jgi:beta-lactamase superfamily II metal-dependent hydrolase